MQGKILYIEKHRQEAMFLLIYNIKVRLFALKLRKMKAPLINTYIYIWPHELPSHQPNLLSQWKTVEVSIPEHQKPQVLMDQVLTSIRPTAVTLIPFFHTPWVLKTAKTTKLSPSMVSCHLFVKGYTFFSPCDR